MKVVLIRTGSSPIQGSPAAHGLLKISVGDYDSITGTLFPGKNRSLSPRSSLHYNKEKKKDCSTSIRRTSSETDMIRSKFSCRRNVSTNGSRSFHARIPEEVLVEDEEEGFGGLILRKKGLSQLIEDEVRNEAFLVKELEFSGGGSGNGRKVGGGGGGVGGGSDFSGGNAEQNKIGEYYQEMLKANPGNALLLRNYGQYLHEVKGDTVKAEECYQRAILASPGDGEVLSLYGNLIWDAHGDGERATSYFNQSVQASPDDCFVLGSYAHFLWNSDEDEEEEETQIKTRSASAALVEAF